MLCVVCLDVGFVFCQCVGWVTGLDFCLGLAGESCCVNILVGFPFAGFVVFGQGCVHAWCCVCCLFCGCMV